jgi:hypothetical protein
VKLINRLCRKNAELLIVEADGTYRYHWASRNIPLQPMVFCETEGPDSYISRNQNLTLSKEKN